MNWYLLWIKSWKGNNNNAATISYSCCQLNGYVEICEWFYYKIHSPLMEAVSINNAFRKWCILGRGWLKIPWSIILPLLRWRLGKWKSLTHFIKFKHLFVRAELGWAGMLNHDLAACYKYPRRHRDIVRNIQHWMVSGIRPVCLFLALCWHCIGIATSNV